MRHYEILTLVDPTLTAEDRDALLTDIKSEITQLGATITLEDVWGVKNLAYKIKGSWEGFYIRYEFDLPQGDFFALSKSLNIKKALWRYMIVKISD